MRRLKQQGFTLVELLVVVAIMAILVTVALPAYQNSALRSGRAEAKGELLQVAAEQERYYSSFNTYIDDATPMTTPTVANRDRTSTNATYLISVAACAGGAISNCFLATATAQGVQLDDLCDTLTISNTGIRGATGTGATAEECWQR